jgi:DNA-binding MarR family transcriptional regulator
MTNRLDRLEKRNLIRRLPNPDDGRGLDIELTDEGRRLVDRLIGEHVAKEQQMLEPLSQRERDQLQRITRKLLAHLTS